MDRTSLVIGELEHVVDRESVRREEGNTALEGRQTLRVGYRGYLDCTFEPPTISPGQTCGKM
jgi:hypothetical protein